EHADAGLISASPAIADATCRGLHRSQCAQNWEEEGLYATEDVLGLGNVGCRDLQQCRSLQRGRGPRRRAGRKLARRSATLAAVRGAAGMGVRAGPLLQRAGRALSGRASVRALRAGARSLLQDLRSGVRL